MILSTWTITLKSRRTNEFNYIHVYQPSPPSFLSCGFVAVLREIDVGRTYAQILIVQMSYALGWKITRDTVLNNN